MYTQNISYNESKEIIIQHFFYKAMFSCEQPQSMPSHLVWKD